MDGFRTLLMGEPGGGKSTSLNTLARDCGLETFILFLEKGDHVIDKSNPKIHYNYISTFSQSWTGMIANAQKLQNFSRKKLLELEGDTRSFPQFLDLLNMLNNFTDIHGNQYGDVSTWGPDKALCIDGLTGLNKIAMSLVTGDKPARTISDYGLAMQNLENIIDKLVLDLHCHFVLVAHLERERDEVLGTTRVYPSALGQKLSPKIANNFQDAVLCEKVGKEFYWSTSDPQCSLKYFYLPNQSKLQPTFKTIYDKWKTQQQGEIDV